MDNFDDIFKKLDDSLGFNTELVQKHTFSLLMQNQAMLRAIVLQFPKLVGMSIDESIDFEQKVREETNKIYYALGARYFGKFGK